MEPFYVADAALVYFLVCLETAVGKGGRRSGQRTAPAVTFAQRPFGVCDIKPPCWNWIIVVQTHKLEPWKSLNESRNVLKMASADLLPESNRWMEAKKSNFLLRQIRVQLIFK